MFEEYNISCVPISGFEIATRMGIKVIPYSSFDKQIQKLLLKKSEDGFTKNDQGAYTIYYNDNKSYGRINNTIMHEVAHVVLGHIEESDLAEAEAKFFAKYALAPPPLIDKLQLSSPGEIASVFAISFEAAAYAYEYYHKWLEYGGKYYKDYEVKLLALFPEVM